LEDFHVVFVLHFVYSFMEVTLQMKVSFGLGLDSGMTIVTRFHTSRSGRKASTIWHVSSLSNLEICTIISIWNSLENYCENKLGRQIFQWEYLPNL